MGLTYLGVHAHLCDCSFFKWRCILIYTRILFGIDKKYMHLNLRKYLQHSYNMDKMVSHTCMCEKEKYILQNLVYWLALTYLVK